MENYYEVLNVVNFADEEVIRASYKALAKKYHPDINKSADPNIMVRINNAYDVLSNSNEKEKYDKQLMEYLEKKKNEETKVHRENQTYVNQVHKGNTDNVTKRDYKDTYDDKPKFSFIRGILSIIITAILGAIVSFVIIGLLSEDGSWSYILYSFFGAFIGFMIRKISGRESVVLGAIAVLITIICIVFPYYGYLYENTGILYGELTEVGKFLNIIKEIASYLLGSGIIRMAFVLMSPVMAYEYASDE